MILEVIINFLVYVDFFNFYLYYIFSFFCYIQFFYFFDYGLFFMWMKIKCECFDLYFISLEKQLQEVLFLYFNDIQVQLNEMLINFYWFKDMVWKLGFVNNNGYDVEFFYFFLLMVVYFLGNLGLQGFGFFEKLFSIIYDFFEVFFM